MNSFFYVSLLLKNSGTNASILLDTVGASKVLGAGELWRLSQPEN